MDARQIRPAPHPLLALRMVPERADHLPTLSIIGRTEQAAGQGSAPDEPGLIGSPGRERPDPCCAPVQWPVPHVVLFIPVRFRRIGRGGDLFPPHLRPAVELDAKVTVIESRVTATVPPVGQCDGAATTEKIRGCNFPLPRHTRYRKEAFAGRNENRFAHVNLPTALGTRRCCWSRPRRR